MYARVFVWGWVKMHVCVCVSVLCYMSIWPFQIRPRAPRLPYLLWTVFKCLNVQNVLPLLSLLSVCVRMDYTPLFSLSPLCSLSRTLVAESHTGEIPDLYQVAVRLCLNHLSLPSFLSLHACLAHCLCHYYSVSSLLYIEGLTLTIHIVLHSPINAYKVQASLCVCKNGVIIFWLSLVGDNPPTTTTLCIT